MSTTTKYLLGSQTTLLGTELNSLTTTGYTSAGAAYDNTQGQTGDGATLCDVELSCTFAANPNAGSTISLWFLLSQDGSNYEDTPTSSIGLGRPPDVILPVTSGQTTTRVTRRTLMPPGKFKPVARADTTGQTMNSSGNTIKIRPVYLQQV